MPKLWPIFSGILFVFDVLAAPAQQSAHNAGKIDQVLKQLEKVTRFEAVTISPDAHWLTWSQEAAGGGEVFLRAQSGDAAPVRVTAGDSKTATEEGGVSWSPDSLSLAFLSSNGSDQQQIYVLNIGHGKPRVLTNIKGFVKDVRWSPDGRTLAFLYAENGGGAGPLAAVPAQTGVIGDEIHNQRIALVSRNGGEVRQITKPDLNIYEYDWSPDGTRFAAIAAPGPADNNWWTAKLYLVDRTTRATSLLYTPPADRQLAVPRWSPDGTQVAFIGGLMSDEGFVGGDVFEVAEEGGSARNLTPGTKASPNGLHWQSDKRILVTEALDGGGAMELLDAASGKEEMVWKGDRTLHQDGNYPNFSLAKDGRSSAAVVSSWEHPPEIWAGAIGEWQQVTHANAALHPQWGKAASVVWKSEGFRAQGWLVYPENFDASKKYPMVVEIHGGPAGVRTAGWPSPSFDMSVMSGLGYFVFFPNPRGSYGEGEAFTRANVKDFGGGDLRDIMAGVDAVLKMTPVDQKRIGVTGWSYGGFMTMWTVTQTNRFRAAVAGAGIANWQSYYGENSIDEWMIPYFGASVYDAPQVYAKSSPITFVKQVKTPTLVVVGERDGECPAPQSFEFWHALKTLGVPTELVVYPGEGHSFRESKNRVDVLRRTLEWFDRYLGE